jgi:antitoxin component YwqK of YwqJK toxin-antitoxin module
MVKMKIGVIILLLQLATLGYSQSQTEFVDDCNCTIENGKYIDKNTCLKCSGLFLCYDTLFVNFDVSEKHFRNILKSNIKLRVISNGFLMKESFLYENGNINYSLDYDSTGRILNDTIKYYDKDGILNSKYPIVNGKINGSSSENNQLTSSTNLYLNGKLNGVSYEIDNLTHKISSLDTYYDGKKEGLTLHFNDLVGGLSDEILFINNVNKVKSDAVEINTYSYYKNGKLESITRNNKITHVDEYFYFSIDGELLRFIIKKDDAVIFQINK